MYLLRINLNWPKKGVQNHESCNEIRPQDQPRPVCLHAGDRSKADPPGQKIYTQGGESPAAMACATCHGANGMGTDSAGFPRLAGLPQGYLVKQLEDFRSGKRVNAVMQPIALALDDTEGKAVASYLGALDIAAAEC